MHLVSTETPSANPLLHFNGVPLSVVFAEPEALEEARATGRGVIRLEPPFHVSDDDVYFVVPDDIGMELVDILRDEDTDLLHEAMRDSLLVLGPIVRVGNGVTELHVEIALPPAAALAAGMPYAARVPLRRGSNALEMINALDHLKCTVVSSLFDDEGLEAALRRAEFVGTSWRSSNEEERQGCGVDPTHVWTKRLGTGRVGVELALFAEYEELVALLRPVEICAA